MNRDKQGRFTQGNTIARNGWDGLVRKRFSGEAVAAREWVGAVGRWAYAQQTGIVRRGAFQHPGSPENFLVNWKSRMSFTLADVSELSF